MDIDKIYDKFIDVTSQKGDKLLNNMTYNEYLNISVGYKYWINENKPYYKFYMFTDIEFKRKIRETMMITLNNINYKRKNNEWTTPAVVCFINEVLNVYQNKYLKEDAIKEKEISISKMFNVPINRLKTQVALFLNNLEKNRDNFNLHYYFNDLELVAWKYRDNDKLYNDVEKDTISSKDKKLIKEIYDI